MKKIIIALISLIAFAACTDNFIETNTNPNQISKEQLLEDNNLVGSPFSIMIYNLNGGQVEEDLCADNWMGYMGTPTDFVGNVNNTTYSIT